MLAGGAGVAALATVNATLAARRKVVPDSVAATVGTKHFYEWKHGRIFYRATGRDDAPPILFVHSTGPGVSNFMWRHNIDALAAADFRVYALDLLGFGASDKPADASYSADLYVDLIADFLRDVVKQKSHIVASALGACFALRVADEYEELVSDLLLIAPSGADEGASTGVKGARFYSLLHSPVLGGSFYNAIASERSLRDYARKQLFYNKRFATDSLVAHLYAMSHQPGAQHPMTAFLSGYLDMDTRASLARIRRNVTIVYGRQDRSHTTGRINELRTLNARARIEIFDYARLWLQEEHAAKFNMLAIDAFSRRARSAAA